MDHARQSFRQARDSAGTSLNDSRQQAADRIGGIANAVRGTSERLRSEQQDRVADLTDSLADNVDRLSPISATATWPTSGVTPKTSPGGSRPSPWASPWPSA